MTGRYPVIFFGGTSKMIGNSPIKFDVLLILIYRLLYIKRERRRHDGFF